MSVRKASVLELATAAYDLDASVIRGRLVKSPDGSWTITGVGIDGLACQIRGTRNRPHRRFDG